MSKDRDGKQGWRVLMGPMVSDFGSTLSELNALSNSHYTYVPLTY